MSSQSIRRPARVRGALAAPGDKSISHRAVLLNAFAQGRASITGFVRAADCLSSARCVRALGVAVEVPDDPAAPVVVEGHGPEGWREPEDVLDCGNSGTTMRFLCGLLAGRPFFSVLTGDASLRRRPMARVAVPLRQMGAMIHGRGGDRQAPLAIRGGALRGIGYDLPVASAQVKSALLLAGLQADGPTTVRSPAPSRDHTERMLRAMGATVAGDGTELTVQPLTVPLRAVDVHVPGDVSSAAFWLVLGALHPNAELTVCGVGVNPTRTGVLDVLRAMGADVSVANEREVAGEPLADLTVRSARLRGTEIGGALIPRLIDEIPVLAVAAALAEGPTVIRDAAELRVKESDRIAALCHELARLGAAVAERPDGLVIGGVRRLHGAVCESHGDHRLAMALAVAGAVAEGETVVQGAEVAAVSYPGFWQDLERLCGGLR
ncbi:MAG: 3-phosphoshikimate 1-carboxyvinyltransferase [Chloroflexi bacterium]|nr:3-phosphoshikimate 1-carboxyvinyltransferase [Chloroflexota bacterium]